ncbi:MAG: PIN domain-containing protein [Defluviitaleaceae bacterium]|nr:PIN domain-containing protein [Defluviitaleaceae bacterium]
MVYVFDTNTIIHYLRDNPTVIANLEVAVDNYDFMVIPFVVDYEIRCGYEVKPAPNKEAHYDILSKRTDFCTVASMGDGFWAIAAKVYAEIYKKHLTIGENDIQIAAFCLHNGYTLVTNDADYQNITGLQLVDWTK